MAGWDGWGREGEECESFWVGRGWTGGRKGVTRGRTWWHPYLENYCRRPWYTTLCILVEYCVCFMGTAAFFFLLKYLGGWGN